jgi:DnaJ-class molecular chaperone
MTALDALQFRHGLGNAARANLSRMPEGAEPCDACDGTGETLDTADCRCPADYVCRECEGSGWVDVEMECAA